MELMFQVFLLELALSFLMVVDFQIHDQIGVYNFIVTTIGSNQCNELSAQGSIEYNVCD